MRRSCSGRLPWIRALPSSSEDRGTWWHALCQLADRAKPAPQSKTIHHEHQLAHAAMHLRRRPLEANTTWQNAYCKQGCVHRPDVAAPVVGVLRRNKDRPTCLAMLLTMQAGSDNSRKPAPMQNQAGKAAAGRAAEAACDSTSPHGTPERAAHCPI